MKVKRILSMALCAAIAASMAGYSKETAGGDVTTVTVWTGNGGDKAFITKEIENWNNTTGKEKGKIMKELMPRVKGKADGGLVNKIVGEMLA